MGIATLRDFPLFGVVSPCDVMARRTVRQRSSKFTSDHWRPSASPRRIPVAKSRTRTGRVRRRGAVRELPMASGPADYLLFVDGRSAAAR